MESRPRIFEAVLLFAVLNLGGCASPGPVESPSGPSAPRPETPTADPDPTPPDTPPVAPDVELDEEMFVCPRITVSNAPPSDEDRRIRDYVPVVDVEGVRLIASPVVGACLSSGFGERGGRLHAGIDVQSRPAGTVRAAGAGEILEADYRADFGNYVLIDHGSGVFTRYAHLEALNPAIVPGAEVSLGTPLGRMGNSADFPIPVHLHFELLTGDYDTPEKSFGLTPRDILSVPPPGG